MVQNHEPMNLETFLCHLLIDVIVKLFSILIDEKRNNKFITIKFEPSSGELHFHFGRGFRISVWIVILLVVGLLLIETVN